MVFDYGLVDRFVGPVASYGFPIDAVRYIYIEVHNIILALESKSYLGSRLGLGVVFESIVAVF
jgi:hypothetical protein